MAYKDLREFIKTLDEKGLLKRIRAEVDPILEISEITDRMCKSSDGGKALFFEKVRGSAFPVVTNVFGSFERMCLSLEVSRLDDVAARIEEILNQAPPKTLLEKLALLPKLLEFSKFLPRTVKNGPCQEVIERENPDLSIFPILKTWPGDGRPTDEGRFITFPMVFTRDPESGRPNCGMYRIHVYDKVTTGMHWHIHKDGARHYDKYGKLNQRMPAAIAVGSDPAVIYSASAPLPESIDEMLFAGFLRKEPVEMVRCITSDIQVPANSVAKPATASQGPKGIWAYFRLPSSVRASFCDKPNTAPRQQARKMVKIITMIETAIIDKRCLSAHDRVTL